MYTSVRNAPEVPAGPASPGSAAVQAGGRNAVKRVSGAVVAMGFVSFFTDTSSEMVTAILPLFLVSYVGLTPLAYGLVDGLYQGVTVAVRIVAGYLSDKTRRPKLMCGIGYGLSAVTKLGLLGVGSAASASGWLAVDRTGKGIRTAPRDAIIAASSEPAMLGRSFGVHRAMDTAGAMLGPLLALAILAAVPGSYNSIFVASFAIALIGVAVLVLFAPSPKWTPEAAARVSVRAVGGLLRDKRLMLVTAVAGVLGLVTVSDGFVYLTLQKKLESAAEVFPLFAFGTALVYLALAVPFGRLADRVGRRTVFVGGHVALLGSYLILLSPLPPILVCVLALALFGTYYAATDGVLSATAAELLPGHLRTTGLSVVQTAVALGRLLSSLLFGLMWTVSGSQGRALTIFTIALAVALPLAATVLGVGGRRSAKAAAGA